MINKNQLNYKTYPVQVGDFLRLLKYLNKNKLVVIFGMTNKYTKGNKWNKSYTV